MQHHTLVVLGVVAVVMCMKIVQDAQFLERRIQEQPIYPGRIIPHVTQLHHKHSDPVDLLENCFQKLCAKSPTQCHDCLVMWRWAASLPEDFCTVVHHHQQEDSSKMVEELPVELHHNGLGSGGPKR